MAVQEMSRRRILALTALAVVVLGGFRFVVMSINDDALMASAAHGEIEGVREALRVGASPNQVFEGDWTPLMSAVQGGNIQVVELLLRAGADPSVRDYEKLRAVDMTSDVKIVRLIRRYSKG